MQSKNDSEEFVMVQSTYDLIKINEKRSYRFSHL